MYVLDTRHPTFAEQRVIDSTRTHDDKAVREQSASDGTRTRFSPFFRNLVLVRTTALQLRSSTTR